TAKGPLTNDRRREEGKSQKGRKGQACRETCARTSGPHRSLPGIAQCERVSLRGLSRNDPNRKDELHESQTSSSPLGTHETRPSGFERRLRALEACRGVHGPNGHCQAS